MATVYVTFGQRYRDQPHPIDPRAHPDGWFEFSAADVTVAERLAAAYFTLGRVPTFARTWLTPPCLDANGNRTDLFPNGCLATVHITDTGRTHSGEEVARTRIEAQQVLDRIGIDPNAESHLNAIGG